MYWTLELASKLEDAPWPATKDELIDYAMRSGAPLEVIENLQEMEDEGEIYESIEEMCIRDRYVPVRKQSIIDFLEQQKTMYLNALVSDKEEFDRKDALLRSINAQVQSFKDSIR